MNVWRLITHHENPERALSWSKLNDRIAIGWGKIGDLSQHDFKSSKDIGAIIRQHYPELNNSGSGGSSLWSFYSEMQKGDLVILSTGKARELAVEVIGDYEYCEVPDLGGIELSGHYQHQRRVRRSLWDAERLWRIAGARPAEGYSVRHTLLKCEKPLM